jgi:hypothetical protein
MLAATFMRFQEHYESLKFRNRIFTTEEFMDWYASTYGNFDYFSDWDGFNVPSHILTSFYNRRFDPLLEKEKRFLRLLKKAGRESYIIGLHTAKGINLPLLKHEFVHGLFYLKKQTYQSEVRYCLSCFDIRRFCIALEKYGYHSNVLEDELNAYCLTGLDSSLRGIDDELLRRIRERLMKVFKHMFGYTIRCARRSFMLTQLHVIRFV